MQSVTGGGDVVEPLGDYGVGSEAEQAVEPRSLAPVRFGLRNPGSERYLGLDIVERAGPIELASPCCLTAGTEQQEDRSRQEKAHGAARVRSKEKGVTSNE
jgi:hypothetical protein